MRAIRIRTLGLRGGRRWRHRGQLRELAHAVRQALDVPLAAAALAGRRHLVVDQAIDHRQQVGAGVGALEDLATLAVDDLALLVHDVVVLDDVAARIEVVALDARLGALDLAGHHARLDGGVLVDAQAVHDALHALAAEDAHHVVLEGEGEARLAGVALAAGAAAQLVVDAPRLVALGADDVEPAQVGDALAEQDVGAAAGHAGGDG